MSQKPRVLIIVNKYWECDPVCWVLTNNYINTNGQCNIPLMWPDLLTYPANGPVKGLPTTPRMIYDAENTSIEVWCISDLLSRFPNTPEYQSSSQIKMEVMGEIFTYSSAPVSLVVAVGTASSGPFYPMYQSLSQNNINGSVIIGSKVFMHDGHPASDPNPYSEWRCAYFDELMNSSFDISQFIIGSTFTNIETLLLCPPTNPATNGQHLYIDESYVAIGDINVTNYKEYEVKDKAAGDAFITYCPGNTNGVSLETTHGLIYATARDYFNADPPFLFVSGVVDRYTCFNKDVNPKIYAQNVSGAHNAGIAVACILSDILSRAK